MIKTERRTSVLVVSEQDAPEPALVRTAARRARAGGCAFTIFSPATLRERGEVLGADDGARLERFDEVILSLLPGVAVCVSLVG